MRARATHGRAASNARDTWKLPNARIGTELAMNRSFMCHGICSDSSMDALATRYTFAEVNG
jgi:hypothetical protein